MKTRHEYKKKKIKIKIQLVAELGNILCSFQNFINSLCKEKHKKKKNVCVGARRHSFILFNIQYKKFPIITKCYFWLSIEKQE